ncbi:MAG: hypothetical protein ACLRZG_05010 [Streptococcus sp.]
MTSALLGVVTGLAGIAGLTRRKRRGTDLVGTIIFPVNLIGDSLFY